MSAAEATALAAAYGVPVTYLLDDPVPSGIVEELTMLIERRDAGVRVAPSPDR